MEGYKAYNKGLICRPVGNSFQYKIGESYHCDEAILCSTGFHFCKEPLKVLDYYPLIDNYGKYSEFTKVSAKNAITEDGDKYCCTDITIKEKLTFAQLVQEQLKYDKLNRFRFKKQDENYKIAFCPEQGGGIKSSCSDAFLISTFQSGFIKSTGDRAKIYFEQGERTQSSGSYAQILSFSNDGEIESSGAYTNIHSTGLYTSINSSGNNTAIRATGEYTTIKSSGDSAVIYAEGDNMRLYCQGDNPWIVSTGKCNGICCTTRSAQIRAEVGTSIIYYGKNFVAEEEHMSEKGLYYLLEGGKIYLTRLFNPERIEIMK